LAYNGMTIASKIRAQNPQNPHTKTGRAFLAGAFAFVAMSVPPAPTVAQGPRRAEGEKLLEVISKPV
jgi:hypothetical protein